MIIEKITLKDFDVKSEEGKNVIYVFNLKYHDVLSFIWKNIDMIYEPPNRDTIVFHLKKRGYVILNQSFLKDMNTPLETSEGIFMNIFNEYLDIVSCEYVEFTKDELFYDITDVVKKIKEVKYSEKNKENADYIELFKEIKKLSSYELNEDMNPSNVAYNLSTINAMVSNYLKFNN